MTELHRRLTALWAFVRRISGDDAYERYLAHHAEAHSGEPMLSRREFVKQEQAQKWNAVRRCC